MAALENAVRKIRSFFISSKDGKEETKDKEGSMGELEERLKQDTLEAKSEGKGTAPSTSGSNGKLKKTDS